jgi:hypothetical protein
MAHRYLLVLDSLDNLDNLVAQLRIGLTETAGADSNRLQGGAVAERGG